MVLDLKKGKYTVNVTYGGNENYTGNNTTQKLTIKEEVVEEPVTSSSSFQRQTVEEHGTYDNVRDMYIDKQAKGLSKDELAEIEAKIERDGGMI